MLDCKNPNAEEAGWVKGELLVGPSSRRFTSCLTTGLTCLLTGESLSLESSDEDFEESDEDCLRLLDFLLGELCLLVCLIFCSTTGTFIGVGSPHLVEEFYYFIES